MWKPHSHSLRWEFEVALVWHKLTGSTVIFAKGREAVLPLLKEKCTKQTHWVWGLLCGISVCFYLPEPWQMPVAQAHGFHDCILRVVFSFFLQWQKAFAHERDIKQTYVRYKFCLLSAFRCFLALSPRDSLCSLRLCLRALEMN